MVERMGSASKGAGLFLSSSEDSQRESILMSAVEQPNLTFRMEAYPVERELIVSQPNFRGAMDLSLALCRFDNDKDAARALEIDQGLLSKRRNGQAPWQVDDMVKVMERGQNLIPLAYLSHRYGHGLVMLETEAERRERALREQIVQLQMEKRVLTEAIRGQVTA